MKLSLRDALLLVVVVGLVLGWWLDRRQLARRLAAAESRNEAFKEQLATRYTLSGLTWGSGPGRAGSAFPAAGPKVSTDEIVRLLRSPDDDVMIDLEIALRRLDGQPLRDELLAPVLELLESPDLHFQKRAVFVLGHLHSQPEQVVPRLIPLLESSDISLQANALAALGKYGPAAKAAIPAIEQLMKDDTSNLAAHAAYELKNIDPDADIEFRLLQLLDHPLAENRRTAARMIAQDHEMEPALATRALARRLEVETDAHVRKDLATSLNHSRLLSPRPTQ